MTDFLGVVAVAFALQVLALPGEKGQLVVAGLATRYPTRAVVAGAATAFGVWTAVEIVLARRLVGALPAGVLEWIAAGLFLAFAVALAWPTGRPARAESGPDTLADGGVGRLGRLDGRGDRLDGLGGRLDGLADRFEGLPGRFGALAERFDALDDRLGGYVAAFAAMVVGEFGDKTQLVTVALAVQYGAHPGIWVGEMLAVVPASLLTATLASRSAGWLDPGAIRAGAAGVFLALAADLAAARLLGVSMLPL